MLTIVLTETITNMGIGDYLLFHDGSNSKDAIEIWSDILTGFALIVSAIWGYFLFRKNNKIRAADLLLKLEEDYRKHIPILLKVEYSTDSELVDSIKKVYARLPLFPKEDKLIEDFENCLRFFYQTYIIHRKKIDLELFNRAHIYYLYILCNGEKVEISRYIKDYWPSIYRWFLTISLPFYYRAFLIPFLLNEHLPFINSKVKECFKTISDPQPSFYSTIFRKLEFKASIKISEGYFFETLRLSRFIR